MADDKLKDALERTKVPIVTLDNKWHKIFTMVEKSPKIAEREKALNDLLRRQGKLNTESKDIKKIKKKLMDEIVSLMDDNGSDRKIEENKRLIEECNEKLESYQDELMDIPKQIEEVNREVMLLTMEVCYDTMHENETLVEELGDWIKNIRIELKKNVVRKQEKEIQNAIMYSYLHDVFGPEAMDIFDMKTNPLEKMIQLKAAKEAAAKAKGETGGGESSSDNKS